jgi:hypothetical protein
VIPTLAPVGFVPRPAALRNPPPNLPAQRLALVSTTTSDLSAVDDQISEASVAIARDYFFPSMMMFSSADSFAGSSLPPSGNPLFERMNAMTSA